MAIVVVSISVAEFYMIALARQILRAFSRHHAQWRR